MTGTNKNCTFGSEKLFSKAFEQIIISAGNASYTRMALYACFCRYYESTNVNDIRNFIKTKVAKKVTASNICDSAFRGTLSRELRVVDYFLNNFNIDIVMRGFDRTNPTAEKFINKLADFFKSKKLNYAALFGTSESEKQASKQEKQEKQEKLDALKKAENEKATKARKAQAKKAGLTLAAYDCLKAFENLSLSEKNKLLKQLTDHVQKALEQAQKAQKAQMKKALDDKNGVKAGTLKKAA